MILSINPNLTQQEVFDIIKNTADKVGGYDYSFYVNDDNNDYPPDPGRSREMGYGRLNACAAVYKALSTITTFTITGSNTICSNNESYTLNGVSPNTTVMWSQQGPMAAGSYILPLQNVASVPATGNPITVTKISNGNITLIARVMDCSGNVVATAGKDIALGVPPIYNNGAYQDNVNHTKIISGTANPTYITNVPIVLVYANNQYSWTKTQGSPNVTWSLCCTPNNSSARVIFNKPVTYNNQIGFSITTSNTCGSRSDPVYILYNGLNMYSVSPNPASSELTVATVPTPGIDQKTANQNSNGFDRIQIIDKMGNIVLDKKYSFKTKKININVSLLKPDIYVVRIFTEGKTEEHKIIIQR